MARRNRPQKIIPLDRGRGVRERLSPEAFRKLHLEAAKASSVTHLLPVTLPYGEPGASLLVNVPRHALGVAYVLEMRRRFPDAFFLADGHLSCAIGLLEFADLHEIDDGKHRLVHAHPPGTSFPLLKVDVKGIRGEGHVEAANIIADPFGYQVFWHLIQQCPKAHFHTADFGQLPIRSIDHQGLWDLNFSG